MELFKCFASLFSGFRSVTLKFIFSAFVMRVHSHTFVIICFVSFYLSHLKNTCILDINFSFSELLFLQTFLCKLALDFLKLFTFVRRPNLFHSTSRIYSSQLGRARARTRESHVFNELGLALCIITIQPAGLLHRTFFLHIFFQMLNLCVLINKKRYYNCCMLL